MQFGEDDMDFGGSPEKDDRNQAKAMNDEDLLLDNFYKKAQTPSVGADFVMIPPTPQTLPK